MTSITLRSHVGTDGILRLDLPVGLADAELEVTVMNDELWNCLDDRRFWKKR
ncbi:MAG: hypothetical protein KME17_12445 [Cyanosarcina radialis HA8281-LM2]|jgi:hypothetical protein|nr:hypothetical protein [Cyanosarcina radialis HA8281-LM2]